SVEIKERYKPKTKTFLIFSSLYGDGESKRILLDSLNRASRQSDAVLGFMQLSKTKEDVSRQDLMEATGCGAGAITALIDKGVFEVKQKVVSRFQGMDVLLTKDFTFSEIQQKAFEDINTHFEQKDVVL